MEQWNEYKLGEILTIKYGKDHKQIADGNIPIYGSGGIMRYGERSIYNGPSILIPRKGSLNNVMFVDKPFWTVDTMFWSIINKDIANPLFVYYSICKKDFANLNVGSAVPSLTVPIIEDIDILLPSKVTQDKVVAVLKSLDDKIEVNKRINDNLEQQAQALFKSWFVYFEPFKDGEFVDSELGMIPKGWRVVCLGEITKECKEKVGNRQDVRVLSPVTTGVLLLSEEYFTKQVFSDNISKYIIVKPNEFAYNPARVNIGSLGINTFSFDGCVSPVYVVFKTEQYYHHFFNLFRKREAFKIEINSRAIGGVRQTLSYKDFSLIKLVYPPQSVIFEFNAIYITLLNKIESALAETKHLAQLRDTLLPRLMSGELKINDLNC